MYDALMITPKRLRQYLLALIASGCAPAKPVPPPQGVLRFAPKNLPPSLPGPMPHFGPFDSRLDALLAACPLLLSQPGATAGRADDTSFNARWRGSTEYCSWLYYTPAGKYEMSMMVESADPIPPDHQNERFCKIPASVDDKRYPPRSLKHLYILHNHPAVPTNISNNDIGAVVKLARIHGQFAETSEGRIQVGIVAFFSNSYEPSPSSCDGFFEYSWGSTEVVRWRRDEQGQWRQEKAGTVTWLNETEFDFRPSQE
jgi:hypothetical protein